MADQKATVTLKDGTKIILDDLSEISKYSDRQDLDSISFFGDDEAAAAVPDAGVPDAGTEQKTVATVEQPKTDPVVPKPQPVADHSAAITATVGALAGAVSSAGMPALANLAKSFIKGKLKLKGKSGSESRPEDEKDEPTDCKTHQLKASAKFVSISARISALESRQNGDSKLFNNSDNSLDDIEERLEKIEKYIKTLNKKKK
jgi:hypothetical protein